MERVLGKKQSIQNEEWLKAEKRIEELVSREVLDEKVRSTVEEIRQMTDGKKVAYAWSAGKDSLVLGEICRDSGVTDCMMAICNLEYPAFLKWVEGKQLGMKPEEIFRLSDFSKEDFLNMMTKGVTGFSNAEYVTKI